jgi:hypothetical protein
VGGIGEGLGGIELEGEGLEFKTVGKFILRVNHQIPPLINPPVISKARIKIVVSFF